MAENQAFPRSLLDTHKNEAADEAAIQIVEQSKQIPTGVSEGPLSPISSTVETLEDNMKLNT